MSVDSITQPPSCSSETLTFNCQVNFASLLIKWNHTVFEIEFLAGFTEVGNNITASDGQVVANLTRRIFMSTGRYLLSSTLIINPPLNSLNINNTNITCEGEGIRNDVAPISLYGEHLRMSLIICIHNYINHCFSLHPVQQVSLPLLMT